MCGFSRDGKTYACFELCLVEFSTFLQRITDYGAWLKNKDLTGESKFNFNAFITVVSYFFIQNNLQCSFSKMFQDAPFFYDPRTQDRITRNSFADQVFRNKPLHFVNRSSGRNSPKIDCGNLQYDVCCV